MGGFLTFRDILDARKGSTRILILGDYSENLAYKGLRGACLDTLKRLQSHLWREGFSETRLVVDFMDEEGVPEESYDEHFLKKSEYYIRHWAEILLFVLLQEGNNQSVVREWSYMIKVCPDKCRNAIIMSNRNVRIGALLRGDIKGHRITNDTFTDASALFRGARKLCFNKLYNLI